ncbi:hypothetical protein CHS0354_031887 [Potamilus streckersoni]|uniref:SAM domain-containing protein n=1 Tax=Potamilus streckersoni TaxID=2493646 RepID=A0AAE0RY93_9BIVA|nr:hypothetical protein CHS0354_031887 [Potamilus streckersoni]
MAENNSNFGQRNGMGHSPRPASTGTYLSQWETKIQELMELLSRTSLETHKLDLMAEISSLKLKLATSDKERRELEERFRNSQRHITDLEAKLALKDADNADLRQRLARNGTVVSSEMNEHEVERLKKAVDALMLSNSEKDKRIEELKRLLKRYKKIEEMVLQAQGRKVLEELVLSFEDDTSSTSSTTPSVTDSAGRENAQQDDGRTDKQLNLSPSASSTPVSSFLEPRVNPVQGPTPPSAITTSTPQKTTVGLVRSSSAENVSKANHKTPPATKRNIEVPKKNGSYAHTEVATDDEDGLQHRGTTGMTHPDIKKKKGLRRFFGKLKRSGSQDFHERERLDEFRRGGVRATATARLGWSRDIRSADDMNLPFGRWDTERVVAWMNEIGLNMYLTECRRWVRHGDQLLKASSHELEKELGLRHPLHRKKLQLALQLISTENPKRDRVSELDHNWVTRWLDDIGLPQYKDTFYDARVDGRMLHVLTVDDLLALKVTNELHHFSIKRGIQILRVNSFNPMCLRRRPTQDEVGTIKREGALINVPGEVALWTNHRVMEWLRTIDLSEYAPNLRGSGVHGALLVLEPRFNAELFAQLLSIPGNKTLLRRHLSTHFVALIGNDVQIKKREFESMPGYVPLIPNAKIKNRGKFALFGHKRSKSETEADGFICPLDLTTPISQEQLRNGTMPRNEAQDGMHKDENAAKEIGAFSKEISTLTNMLARENFLENVPTSNV